MAIAGNCANCNRPTNDHHPRCPTLTYPQVDGVYQGTHRRPGAYQTLMYGGPRPSIFDAPDAATTHAKQTAHALIHEYQTFATQPGHWTADQSAAWIGQACAVLTELAK